MCVHTGLRSGFIIRKPTASTPGWRAYSRCCRETSASVQCVAPRTIRHRRGDATRGTHAASAVTRSSRPRDSVAFASCPCPVRIWRTSRIGAFLPRSMRRTNQCDVVAPRGNSLRTSFETRSAGEHAGVDPEPVCMGDSCTPLLLRRKRSRHSLQRRRRARRIGIDIALRETKASPRATRKFACGVGETRRCRIVR